MLLSSAKNRNRDPFYLFLIGFSSIYFLSLVCLAHYVDIWEDEAYSLNTTAHSLSKVIKLSYDFEGQPPFYFIILAIWRLIHPGVFFAKLLSIAFIAASAFYFHQVVSLFIKGRKSFWVVTIFLLNPFTIWAALEIRLYALVILLSVSSLFYFLRYFKQEKNKDLIILLALCLFGLYTQYFFALLMVSFALSLLVFKNWKASLKFCIWSIPVVILFLPNFIFLSDQISMSVAPLHSLKERILYIAFTPQDFLLALNVMPGNILLRWLIKIPLGLLFIYALYKIIKLQKNRDGNEYLFFAKNLTFILLVLIFQFIIVFISLKLFYQSKYLAIGFPFTILLFSVFYAFSKISRNILFIAVVIYYLSLLFIEYQNPTKTYDFVSTSKFIDRNIKQDEPILFFGKSIIPPFEYYYKNNNPLFGLPTLKYDKYYYHHEILDTSELKKAIKNTPLHTESFLLVLGSIRGYKYKDQLSPENIQISLRKEYAITLDTIIRSPNSDNTLRIQRLIKLNKR